MKWIWKESENSKLILASLGVHSGRIKPLEQPVVVLLPKANLMWDRWSSGSGGWSGEGSAGETEVQTRLQSPVALHTEGTTLVGTWTMLKASVSPPNLLVVMPCYSGDPGQEGQKTLLLANTKNFRWFKCLGAGWIIISADLSTEFSSLIIWVILCIG